MLPRHPALCLPDAYRACSKEPACTLPCCQTLKLCFCFGITPISSRPGCRTMQVWVTFWGDHSMESREPKLQWHGDKVCPCYLHPKAIVLHVQSLCRATGPPVPQQVPCHVASCRAEDMEMADVDGRTLSCANQVGLTPAAARFCMPWVPCKSSVSLCLRCMVQHEGRTTAWPNVAAAPQTGVACSSSAFHCRVGRFMRSAFSSHWLTPTATD